MNDSNDRRVRDLGTYEMIWDCKFCGSQRLPAKTHRFCPNCGAAQDPNSRRFPSDAEKRAVESRVDKGADLICASCSTLNDGDAKFCRQCGALLENAQRASTIQDEVRTATQQFKEGEQRDLEGEELQRDLGTLGAQSASKGQTNWLLIALGVVFLVVIIGVVASLFWTRPNNVYVTGHSWQREILVESLAPRNDSAWCDSRPADAYNISVRSEQRDTRQVPDGEICEVRRIDNGDGTFSERQECRTRYREEPIYDDRCYFTVDRWGYERSVVTSGASLASAPVWGTLNLSRVSGIGAEREAGRREAYVLQLRGAEDQVFECPVDLSTWQNAQIESTWTVEVGVVTGSPACDTLQRAG